MRIEPIYSAKNLPSRQNRYEESSERKLRLDVLVTAIKKIGWFQLVWYPLFAIGGLVALILAAVYEGAFGFILVVSLLEILLAMIASNLIANGKRFGIIVSLLGLMAYTTVALYTRVWGEVITNILIFMPLELHAFISWKKAVDSDNKLEVIRKTRISHVLLWTGILIVTITVCWAFLEFVLHQHFAFLNAIVIMSFLLGTVLRNKRYKYFWYFFILGNITGIIMWVSISLSVSMFALPTIVSYLATLTNNFYGIVIWNKIYKNAKKPDVVLLAKRKINIKKVIRLKRTYQNLVHDINLQPDQKKLKTKQNKPKL